MESYRVAVIRVVTFEDKEKLDLHGKLINNYFPNLKTVSYCIPEQYKGVHDDKSYRLATEKIVKLGKDIEQEFDGIIISCAADPGVKELKKEVSIPVIGAGHSLAAFSLNFGNKIGVLGITEDAPVAIQNILGGKLIKSTKPAGVNNTNDLLTDEGKNSVVKRAKELESLGIDSIILACTGMSTIGISNYLNQKISIPVLDAVYVEALTASSILNMRKL